MLLHQPHKAVKVFAAIITSCKSGGRGHIETARKYLDLALNDARDHRGVTTLRGLNLHAYIASLAGDQLHKIRWGELE